MKKRSQHRQIIPTLYTDVLTTVLHHLAGKDIALAGLVCKDWQRVVCTTPSLFVEAAMREFPELVADKASFTSEPSGWRQTYVMSYVQSKEAALQRLHKELVSQKNTLQELNDMYQDKLLTKELVDGYRKMPELHLSSADIVLQIARSWLQLLEDAGVAIRHCPDIKKLELDGLQQVAEDAESLQPVFFRMTDDLIRCSNSWCRCLRKFKRHNPNLHGYVTSLQRLQKTQRDLVKEAQRVAGKFFLHIKLNITQLETSMSELQEGLKQLDKARCNHQTAALSSILACSGLWPINLQMNTVPNHSHAVATEVAMSSPETLFAPATGTRCQQRNQVEAAVREQLLNMFRSSALSMQQNISTIHEYKRAVLETLQQCQVIDQQIKLDACKGAIDEARLAISGLEAQYMPLQTQLARLRQHVP